MQKDCNFIYVMIFISFSCLITWDCDPSNDVENGYLYSVSDYNGNTFSTLSWQGVLIWTVKLFLTEETNSLIFILNFITIKLI